jgi:hypothetical protein
MNKDAEGHKEDIHARTSARSQVSIENFKEQVGILPFERETKWPPWHNPSLGILAFPLYGFAVRHFGCLFPRSVTLGSWFGVSVFRLFEHNLRMEHQNSAKLEMKNQLDIVDVTNISCTGCGR